MHRETASDWIDVDYVMIPREMISQTDYVSGWARVMPMPDKVQRVLW
jgi:hypothetical protein